MQESQRKEHRIFLGLNQCCGAGAALFLAIETLGMGGSGTACGTYLNQNGSNIELKFLKLIFLSFFVVLLPRVLVNTVADSVGLKSLIPAGLVS